MTPDFHGVSRRGKPEHTSDCHCARCEHKIAVRTSTKLGKPPQEAGKMATETVKAAIEPINAAKLLTVIA